MSTSDRETKIYAYIRERKIATVDELAATFYVSAASVRRDLERLQQQRLIKRTHGGAVLLEKTTETGVHVRINENYDSKERVIYTALNHLPEFETVFVDDSSTAYMLAEKMDFSHKLVVTNGLNLATLLSKRRDVNIILPGGTLLYNTGMLSGSYTIENLRKFRFDLTVTSCTAVDEQSTFERSQDTSLLKDLVIGNGSVNMLLFDASKLKSNAPHRAVALDRFSVAVTDAPPKDIPFINSVKCKIVCAGKLNKSNSRLLTPPPL